MALTKGQKDRLDKLDFAKGGGFSDFLTERKKLESAGSKFLFVGLGGKGCNTVAGIKTNVYKKINCPEGKTHPDNFEYLAVDTDVETLEFLCRGGFGEIGLNADPNDNEVCQLYDGNAAKKLKPGNRRLIPSYITSWLNPTMNQELQGKGAGGIRQAGRYLLFGEEAFMRLKNALTQKIQRLANQIVNPMKEKLIIYIFAGLSGGTGSGTIIDVPYIIREICNQNNWDVKIYSYIFLPDTYPEQARGDHLKYNSYAALKEIDFLMNIGDMDGTAHFRATYIPEFSVDSVERIFDSCILVSGKKNDGTVPNPDKFTRSVVVNNIISLITNNVTSAGFMANSFLDNTPTEIQNSLASLQIPKNAFYQYTVIGTGAVILPLEQILAYITHGSMEKMEEAWNKHAEQKDVEDVLGKIHMAPQELADAIINKSRVPLMEYTKGIGGMSRKQDIIDDSLFNTIKSYWMGQNVSLYDAWNVAKNQCLEHIVQDLNKYYESAFHDPDKGIYFLREFVSFRLVDGRNFNGLLARLNTEYMSSVSGLIGGQEEIIRQTEHRMREIKAELESPFCLFPANKVEEYRSCCVQKLVSENMIEIYRVIVMDCLRQIISWLEMKQEELQSYIDIFTYMKAVVDNNYERVMTDSMPQAEYAGRLIEFSDRKNNQATANVLDYLDSMLSGKTPEGLVTALENDILKTQTKWLHNVDSFNPMEVFVGFIEKQYPNLINLTIEKFLGLKYGQDGLQVGMQEICEGLKNRAEVIFPTNAYMNLISLASHKYVVIPGGTGVLGSSVSNFAQTNGASVAMGSDMNSIYWYNLVIGVPLFAFSDIEDYERRYEINNVSGIHIQESQEENWKDFPALTNQQRWANGDFNSRERKFVSKVQEDVTKFLQCGLIRRSDNLKGNYIAYGFAEEDSRYTKEKILEWCRETYVTTPVLNSDGLMDTGKLFFERMRTENFFEEFQVNIPTVYMNVDNNNLYQIVRMNIFLYKKLKATYEVYEKGVEIIKDANAKREEELRNHKYLERFYDYIRMGIIQIGEAAVYLEKKDKEQEEILYYDDYTQREMQFFIYYAFQNFQNRYTEEELVEIDEYQKELASDHSEEARNRYRALSDNFMEKCEEARNSLRKLEVKRLFEQNAEGHLFEQFVSVYDKLISLRH